MTRVHVKKLDFKPNYFALIDSDTGETITFGSQAEMELRAKRVTEIHDRHAAMSQELECNCDVPNQVQCDLHGPRE